MTREKLYQSMYTNDTVYRPPQEDGSALLEVTLGCSWKRCAFCDFSRDAFRRIPLELIEKRLQTLAALDPDNTRMFFLSENAFCLGTEQLLERMELARRYLPKLESFAMYARADDILRKTPAELALLREKGLTDLYLGVESGSDTVLAMVNKGLTAEQTLSAMWMLEKTGIAYSVTIILGLGGRQLRNLHAIETGRLLSRAHPKFIWALALKLWPGTILEKEARAGLFDAMTPRELLFEERLLLQNLSVKDCTYMDSTVMGTMTIQGYLPDSKDSMLRIIERLLAQSNPGAVHGAFLG